MTSAAFIHMMNVKASKGESSQSFTSVNVSLAKQIKGKIRPIGVEDNCRQLNVYVPQYV